MGAVSWGLGGRIYGARGRLWGGYGLVVGRLWVSCGAVTGRSYGAAVLRKAQESQKEMELLLDMYKSAPKEQRDKVQLMAAERKSKAEVMHAKIC